MEIKQKMNIFNMLEDRYIFCIFSIILFMILHDRYVCNMIEKYEQKQIFKENINEMIDKLQNDLNKTMKKIQILQQQQDQHMFRLVEIIQSKKDEIE